MWPLNQSVAPSPGYRGRGHHRRLEAEGLVARTGAAAAGPTALSTRCAETLAYFRAKQREFFLQQLRPAVGALYLGGAGQNQFFKVTAAHEAMIFVDRHRDVPLLLTDALESVVILRPLLYYHCYEHSTLEGRGQREPHSHKGTGIAPTASV